LATAGGDADALGRPEQPIADEDVGREVRVLGDEVLGQRDEGDEAPVAADRGRLAVLVALNAGAAEADELGKARRGQRGCSTGEDEDARNRERRENDLRGRWKSLRERGAHGLPSPA
jgi:hypothetical protein